MSGLEEDYEYNCPYCVAPGSLRVDATGGRQQSFVVDCEVCCRPLAIEIDIDDDGYVNFTVKREGEG